jgi:hypothetical protein
MIITQSTIVFFTDGSGLSRSAYKVEEEEELVLDSLDVMCRLRIQHTNIALDQVSIGYKVLILHTKTGSHFD